MKIGILECGHTPPAIAAAHGTYPEMFARLFDGRDWRFATWPVKDMAFPDGAGDADAWLLTGSRFGAYEDHAFIAPLEAFIRRARDAGRPMLGVCFGHQMIAQALGGRVEKAAQGWGLGRHIYDVNDCGALALNAWHQDQVVSAPEEAAVLARSAFCPLAGLRYGDWALSLQAHPEFDKDVMRDLIALRRDNPAYPPDRMARAEADLDRPIDTGAAVRLMAGFLEGTTARAHV
jgi:GMP synthase-like glutamine amidotransferase